MSTTFEPGTFVEVLESGESVGHFAVVIEPQQMFFADDDARVWVRYANGCDCPVREHKVHQLTTEQILERLDASR